MGLLGRTLGGRYRLDATLGAGGMATVFRAWDVELDRPVAIKILASNLAVDETFAARFRREARTQARVHHPAIVAVYDVGEADGTPFIVMELVEGGSLATRLTRDGTIPPDALAPILTAVAAGIAALHGAGLIHRDIKPHNILLPAEGGAKLADFGLVRGDATSELTLPGTALGTLGYVAPEVLHGDPASAASDVFAFGVVAFQALTGQRPSTPAVPPSALAPWLGTAYDEPLRMALSPAAMRPGIETLTTALEAAHTSWAAASGQHATDPSAVTVLRPTMAVQPADESSTRLEGRPSSVGCLASAIIGGTILAILAVLVVWFANQPGAIGPTAPPGSIGTSAPSPSTTAQPSPSASASPTPAPTATVAPTTAVQAALAAVEAFDRTVADLQGGPSGLKGKDAKSLTDLAGQVQSALQGGDVAQAQATAGRLLDQSNHLAEHLSDTAASQLKGAAQDVQSAVARL